MFNEKKLFFMSGLPRSGSTLFLQILGQNPNHLVTATDGIIESYLSVSSKWRESVEFKAQGLDKVKPKMENALKGLLYGYHENDENKNIYFNKSRGWLQHIETLNHVLKHDVKVIVTVRDVRAIVASFEKLWRNKGSIEHMYSYGDDFVQSQTVEGRAEILLRPGNVVGLSITRLRDVLRRCPENVILVPYYQLVNEPKSVMQTLHKMLELEPYEYDYDNISQITKEDDIVHGWEGLHNVKSKITSPEMVSWEGIFNPQFEKQLSETYVDINKMALY